MSYCVITLLVLTMTVSVCIYTTSYANETTTIPPIMIRFHFIRHGETEANREGIVLGQTESSLTSGGKHQAVTTGKALKDQQKRQGFKYWRVYSSDLHRARDTAELIVARFSSQEDRSHENELPIQIDTLLRERAKGVREGRPKRLSYQEALELHQKEEQAVGHSLPLPLLESEEEVWHRLAEFIGSVVQEALVLEEKGFFGDDAFHVEQQSTSTSVENWNPVTNTHGTTGQIRTLHVLAVSHSGSIRILLNRFLGGDHWTGRETPCSKVDTGMVIPNGSITTIDVVPTHTTHSHHEHPQKNGVKNDSALSNFWGAINVQLPNTKHLETQHNCSVSHDR